MTQKSEHFHGSDLEKIEAIYHIPREEITSFAANVNPIGISPKLRSTLAEHIDDITGYPERECRSKTGVCRDASGAGSKASGAGKASDGNRKKRTACKRGRATAVGRGD